MRAPLMSSQERFWWMAKLNASARIHHLPLGLRVEGAIDEQRLDAALASLLARQSALRTQLVEKDGRVEQEILATVSAPIERIDLSSLSKAEQDARIGEELTRVLHIPFDLSSAPLW